MWRKISKETKVGDNSEGFNHSINIKEKQLPKTILSILVKYQMNS